MTAAITAIKRGYAYVVQNERGHFFSEGNYDILGPPATDGHDAMDWLSKQEWSNGKVGATGCSSTAEYQPAVAAQGHPAFAAMNVQGFGAGVGTRRAVLRTGQLVSRRRGADAVHHLDLRTAEPGAADVPAEHAAGRPGCGLAPVRSRAADAAGGLGEGAGASAGAGHPEERRWAAGHLRRRHAGRDRRPHDPADAERSRLVQGRALARQHADQRAGPLVHVLVRRLGRAEPRDVQPRPQDRRQGSPATSSGRSSPRSAHCAFTRATENTVVGERSMGDARLDYHEIMYGFFDRFLKGEEGGRLATLPKVTYFTMGSNKWQSSDTWPPAGAQPMTLYLASSGTCEHAERRRHARRRRASSRLARTRSPTTR